MISMMSSFSSNNKKKVNHSPIIQVREIALSHEAEEAIEVVALEGHRTNITVETSHSIHLVVAVGIITIIIMHIIIEGAVTTNLATLLRVNRSQGHNMVVKTPPQLEEVVQMPTLNLYPMAEAVDLMKPTSQQVVDFNSRTITITITTMVTIKDKPIQLIKEVIRSPLIVAAKLQLVAQHKGIKVLSQVRVVITKIQMVVEDTTTETKGNLHTKEVMINREKPTHSTIITMAVKCSKISNKDQDRIITGSRKLTQLMGLGAVRENHIVSIITNTINRTTFNHIKVVEVIRELEVAVSSEVTNKLHINSSNS